MNIIFTLIIIFILYCLIDFIYKNFRYKSFKGPIVLPILGSLIHIKDNTHKVLQKDSKIYNNGKFARYYFCDTLTLAIFDVELMRQIFIKNNESINSRVKTPSTNIIGNRFRGIVTADEVYWHFHRDILMKSFTGTKIKTLSTSIQQEVNHLIGYMKSVAKSGEPFIPRTNFMNFNSNIVFDYVFSRRIENIYQGTNSEQNKVLIAIRELFDFLADTKIYNYLELTKPFYFLYLKLVGHPSDKLKSILRKYYLEHCDTIDFNKPRDVLDSLIIEYRKSNGKEEEQSCVAMTNELILAGVETNSATMETLILKLTNRPEYQDKLYNELISVLNKTNGNDNTKSATTTTSINLSHRPLTPLFNATLKEVMRLSPPVPFGVPRVAVQDFEVDGLFIPKGTQIIQSLYSMFRDESHYNQPDEFLPERFLTDTHSNNYFPYGVGSRNCLGMAVSQDELYLCLTNLILTFKFISPDNNYIDEEPVFGFSFHPNEYKVKLELR